MSDSATPFQSAEPFGKHDFRSLNVLRPVSASELPARLRPLLDHAGLLTPELEKQAGQPIQIELVRSSLRRDQLRRSVYLRGKVSGERFAYGQLRVSLLRLSDEVRQGVLAAVVPFGALLRETNTACYTIPEFFKMSVREQTYSVGTLYGRRSTIRTATGRLLAKAVEVLRIGPDGQVLCPRGEALA